MTRASIAFIVMVTLQFVLLGQIAAVRVEAAEFSSPSRKSSAAFVVSNVRNEWLQPRPRLAGGGPDAMSLTKPLVTSFDFVAPTYKANLFEPPAQRIWLTHRALLI